MTPTRQGSHVKLWIERNLALIFFAAALLFLAAYFLQDGLSHNAAPLSLRSDATLPEGAPIRVHVAGAVLYPGVYELRQGDRVIDALTAAGGPSDDADANELNLARRARDEEQIVVPQRSAATLTSEPLLLVAPGGLIDINAATAQQLDALPGIGEAYSRRIVDSRAVDGRFTTIEELVSRGVLPRRTLDGIRELITVAP